MNLRRGVVIGLIVLAGMTSWRNAESATGSLGGYMFGDYYYVISGEDEKQNGFLFRRIYLTYNLKWDDHFSGRLRLETSDAGFGTGQKMEPFVKHAYLSYKQGRHQMTMGLVGTPTWSLSESLWGYRTVKKTLMDLRKNGSSADLGVDYRVSVGEKDQAYLHLMVGNGGGQVPEEDNGKKIYGNLRLNPKGAYQAAVHVDHEWKDADRKYFSLSAQAGRTGKDTHGGVEGFLRKNSSSLQDNRAWGVSGYLAGRVAEKAKALARLDFYDPSDQGADDGVLMAIGGVDVMPRSDIHVIPNVVYTHYQAVGVDADLTVRITLYFKF